MVAVALPATAAVAAHTVSIPVYYESIVSTQVLANFTWGTPAQVPIPTVIDTGSPGFWVWGPNATINSGSPYLGVLGPCNRTAEPFFDYPKSSTHTANTIGPAAYAYGGNGKIISCDFGLNDTLSFSTNPDNFPALPNQQVSICNFALIKDRSCGISYDKSILGLSPYVAHGPRFRDNLLADGLISDSIYSMYFDAIPKDFNEPQQGTLLLGAVPDMSQYAGNLITVNQTQPDSGFYYVGLPEIRASRIDTPGAASQAIKIETPPSGIIPDCLVDSGTHGLTFPFDSDDLMAKTGLVEASPFINMAYPTPCDQIPVDAALELVFTDSKTGEKATVKLPYRSMIQGLALDNKSICSLALSGGDPTCVLGGTFYAGAVVVHDDVKKTLGFAQNIAGRS